MNTNNTLLKASQLEKSFVNDHQKMLIFTALNLSVNRGDFITIFGNSGAGKSTLLYCLSALLKPDEGELYFENTPLSKASTGFKETLISKDLAFVFQEYHLLEDFTVLENIQISVNLSGKQAISKTLIYEKLKACHLDHLALAYPKQLSGGEQQRIAVLRSLLKKPKIIFCDEPTGNLDAKNAELVLELLVQEQKKVGMAVVMVSHQKQVEAYATKSFQLIDKHLIQIF